MAKAIVDKMSYNELKSDRMVIVLKYKNKQMNVRVNQETEEHIKYIQDYYKREQNVDLSIADVVRMAIKNLHDQFNKKH